MSPEQMLGEPIDGRSDLFSLITVLYWLLTGKRPFVGNTIAALSFNIVHGQAAPPTRLEPTLSQEFDQLAEKGLAKKPEDRYQTGRELADDLHDLLHGRPLRSLAEQPAQAAKEKTAGALSPAWGRPWVLGAGALLVLLLIIVGVGWQRSRPGDGVETPTAVDPTALVPAQPPPEQASPSPQRSRPETRPKAVTTATVRLEGEHTFQEATLSLYADGKLLKRITLLSTAARARFDEQASLPPGDRVLSVTVREQGEIRTERAYLEGRFAQGEARTLHLAFDRRGRMTLRWADLFRPARLPNPALEEKITLSP